MNDTPVIVHPRTGAVLFTQRELACRVTGGLRLDPGFGPVLAELRAEFGRPMRVTSCCRSAEHNARVGGHPRSLHVYDQPNHGLAGTAAIDVVVGNAATVWELVEFAQLGGWSVGLSRNFVHLDRRELAGLPPGAFGY